MFFVIIQLIKLIIIESSTQKLVVSNPTPSRRHVGLDHMPHIVSTFVRAEERACLHANMLADGLAGLTSLSLCLQASSVGYIVKYFRCI